jgi:hypothetical protein
MKLSLSTMYGTQICGLSGLLSPEERARMLVIQQDYREILSDERDGMVFRWALEALPSTRGLS